MLDLNKHMATNENTIQFHTNSIAKVANENRVVTPTDTTFAQRRQIDQQRRVIGGYRNSGIGNTYAELRAKPVLDGATANRPIIQLPPRNKNF